MSSEEAAEIVAAQLRRQGVACSNPKNVLPDLGNSLPHEKVWVLRCDEASYRVTLLLQHEGVHAAVWGS